MTFLVAIWQFLKRVPLWVWVVIALLAAGWLYGNHQFNAGETQGKAEVQAKWDTQKAKDQAEVDRQNRENRAKEAADQKAAATERKTYEQAISAGQERAKALAADLLSERRKLLSFWSGGGCSASPNNAADRSGENDAQLRAEAVGRILGIGAEADARVNFLLSRYAQAEKVCGTIPTE